jgi:1-acyl-sn-glycerol-3-phosphate acyltransferase
MLSALRVFVFFAVTFVAGLFICILHVPLLPLRLLTPRWYQVANIALTSHFWPVLPYLYLQWGHGKIKVYGDALRKEFKCIVFANHQDSRDWLVGFCLAYHSDALGGMKCIMKNTLAFLPVFGWLMFLCDFPFISRQATSVKTIQKFCKKMIHYPQSLWFCLFPEGTRFSMSKLADSIQFCESKQIKPFRRVLCPRIGGFHAALEALRDNIDAVYDVTIMYDTRMSQSQFLKGQGDSTTYVTVREIPIANVPVKEADVKEFLMRAFRVKDDIMTEYAGSFSLNAFVCSHTFFPRFENSKGKDMQKICKIAFGSSVSPAVLKPTEIFFSGYQFHSWAMLEIITYGAWYWLHPSSFILAVSLSLFQ